MPTLNQLICISAFVVAFIATLIAPGTSSEGRSAGCLIAAPKDFVRMKVLDWEFISGLHADGTIDFIDAIRTISEDGKHLSNYDSNRAFQSNESASYESNFQSRTPLLLSNPFNPIKSRRRGTVELDHPTTFIISERRPWVDSVSHVYIFAISNVKNYDAMFEYRHEWTGSFLGVFMRSFEYMPWFFGRGQQLNATPLKVAIEKAWESEKKREDGSVH